MFGMAIRTLKRTTIREHYPSFAEPFIRLLCNLCIPCCAGRRSSLLVICVPNPNSDRDHENESESESEDEDERVRAPRSLQRCRKRVICESDGESGEADNGRGSKRQRGPGGGVARARRLGGGGKVGVRV